MSERRAGYAGDEGGPAADFDQHFVARKRPADMAQLMAADRLGYSPRNLPAEYGVEK
jgi:hypothetical protein